MATRVRAWLERVLRTLESYGTLSRIIALLLSAVARRDVTASDPGTGKADDAAATELRAQRVLAPADAHNRSTNVRRSDVALDDDIWAHVFSFLTIVDASIVCSTCKSHRDLMACSRQHITYLGLNNRELHGSRCRKILRKQDAVNIQEMSSSMMYHSEAYFAPGAWPPLSRLISYYSGLRKLRLSVADSVDGALAAEGVARRFDQRGQRPPQHCGPLPWELLPCTSLQSLTLQSTDEVSDRAHGNLHTSSSAPLVSLFLSAIVPSAARLRVLDLSCLGALLVDTLLLLELPCLVQLQLGHQGGQSCRQTEQRPLSCRATLLPDLGSAFPTLTALDIGCLEVAGGVGCEHLAALCTRCKQLRHLDLSRVMTHVDFGPALQTLAMGARQLCSLAIHGLVVPASGLELLAQHCPQLSTIFLVHCKYTTAALREFLFAAHRLTALDLSASGAPRDVLYDWVEERESCAHPVARLVLHRSRLQFERPFPMEGEVGSEVMSDHDGPFELDHRVPVYATALRELAKQLVALGGPCRHVPLKVITGTGEKTTANWRMPLFATAEETMRLRKAGEYEVLDWRYNIHASRRTVKGYKGGES